MTLLVIQDDEIFVDSFQDMNGYAFSSNKVLPSSIGKFAVIGNVATGCQAMDKCEREGLYVAHDQDKDDYTIVVLRDLEGKAHVLYLGDKTPVFASVRGTNSGGLQFVGGSGCQSFMAYFAEHGDVTKAFELCAAYHRDVELPIEWF